MKEKPIIFTAPMVMAILEGRKTQTRRIMKIQPPAEGYTLATCVSTTGHKRDEGRHHWIKLGDCGYTVCVSTTGHKRDEGRHHWIKLGDCGYTVAYGRQPYFLCPYSVGQIAWVKENFAWYGCERDQAEVIYRADHIGPLPTEYGKWKSSIFMPSWASRISLEITGVRVERLQDISGPDCWAEGIECAGWDSEKYGSVTHCYRDLWESINGPGSWKTNPWVWVVEFKRVEGL